MKGLRSSMSAVLLLAACGPEPHSLAWFEEHPDEIQRVLAKCREQASPGRECTTAERADAEVQAMAREALFRRGFQ